MAGPNGSIQYAAIILDRNVLADYPPKQSGYADLVRRVVDTIPLNAHCKKTLDDDNCSVHYKSAGSRAFICVAGNKFPLRLCYGFLDAVEAGLKVDFDMDNAKRILKEQVALFNDPKQDRMRSVQEEINTVQDIMRDNIDKVINRGMALEDIQARTDNLADQAQDFKRGATKIKRQMRCKNIKIIIVIAVVVLIIIGLIVMIACLASGC